MQKNSTLSHITQGIMLLLMLIPAMMTAVGVVREKELGSITNLYATQHHGVEKFLLLEGGVFTNIFWIGITT